MTHQVDLNRVIATLIAFGGRPLPEGPAEKLLWEVTPDDEVRYRELIRQYTVAEKREFEKINPALCAKGKESLRWLINFGYDYGDASNPSLFDWVFNKGQLWVNVREDPRRFFIWVWEELYPGEDWHIADPSQYVLEE
jgi:hypothetical protein